MHYGFEFVAQPVEEDNIQMNRRAVETEEGVEQTLLAKATRHLSGLHSTTVCMPS